MAKEIDPLQAVPLGACGLLATPNGKETVVGFMGGPCFKAVFELVYRQLFMVKFGGDGFVVSFSFAWALH